MAKHLQLSIAEPCHENWDNMAPADKGRFCDSCQKQVVDFSTMSDRQIAEFFKKPSKGSLCGRFMSDQLERSIEIPRKRIPWLKYFFQFAIPAFLISMKATAQGKVKVAEITSPVEKPTCTPMMGTMTAPVYKKPPNKKQIQGDTTPVVMPTKAEIRPDPQIMGGVAVNPVKVKPAKTSITENIQVKGKVVDENGEPIPLATIVLVNSKKILAVDAMGKFSLNAKQPADLIQLEVSSVGYKTVVYNYPFTFGYTSAVDITIQLTPQSKDMEEVVVTALKIARGRYTLGSLTFKRDTIKTVEAKKDSIVTKDIKPPVVISSMLVYPNPVSSGSQLNISFKEPEEGYYSLQLLSQSGQLVHQEEIWIGSEVGITRFDIPSVAAGSYFLVVTNKKSGKKYTEKIIIQ